MSGTTFSRRAALLGAASLPAMQILRGQSKPRATVISSANRFNGGVNCCAKAMELMRGGADTLDAVIAGVNILELDPRENSVGYGGLPNEDGVVELDASCIHGPSRRMGAVGALQGIKTPSKVARMVMEQTDHMMLAGAGALKFARAMGFEEENLLTEDSRKRWVAWKISLGHGGHTSWGPGLDAPPGPETQQHVLGELRRVFPHDSEAELAAVVHDALFPPHGTINCIAVNEKGEMSAVTTTSGLAWKLPGRLGDSPIIGGGLWLDQDIGGAGSTGRGEENLRVCGAHTVVENMRRGLSPKEAALDALKRVQRNFNNDEKRLSQVDLNFYALRKDGEYAAASLWSPPAGAGPEGHFAVCTGGQASRVESTAFLLERKPL